jgi:UDP-hydrolysing UDP-N-acetyl-D-glucosamine 2-epimerase
MVNKKRKILYISGTRADYGLMRETLLRIKNSPGLELEIIATGMHLMPEFGRTADEIKKDGFSLKKIKAIFKRDDKESMADFIGKLIQLLVKEISKIRPDIILVLGDRGEMLAGAVAGAYLSIPVAHIHGGDITLTVDEIVRHAITKLAIIHFPATEKSAQRIIRMGEDPSKVFVVGAPGLDGILNQKLFSKDEIAKKFGLNFSEPVLLVLQHPVTHEIDQSASQMKETMEAIKELRFQTVLIYPNADAGAREIIKVINNYQKYSFIKIYKNINRKDYLSLMSMANALIGNSSSGIIEGPSFGLPVINIGKRESGREMAENIINVGCQKNEIIEAIKRAIFDKEFITKIKLIKSPYGEGTAGEKIVDVLNKIKIDEKLLQKQITY